MQQISSSHFPPLNFLHSSCPILSLFPFPLVSVNSSINVNVIKDSINPNEKVLIIDDLIATGGTAEAAAKLVELSGGTIAGFIFIINLFDLPGNQKLKDKFYFTESLIEFPGH